MPFPESVSIATSTAMPGEGDDGVVDAHGRFVEATVMGKTKLSG
ncbi:hypothetical protein [Roseiarcus fermentans]|nr:hypothetical protein [Roseiarcus fermentans]